MIDAIIKILDAILSRTANLIPVFLAVASTIGLFSAIGMLATKSVPAESHDAMMLLVGSLGTNWAAVMAFYFGSSAGSQRKTDLMAKNGEQK